MMKTNKRQPMSRLDYCRKVNNAVNLIEDRLLELKKHQAAKSPEWQLTESAFAALYRLQRMAKKRPASALKLRPK